jgi:pimeloyl-ACP methyl ester carboxylesterase
VLRVERPIVVGHSLATQVALAMALDYPRYVRAIALLAGFYYPAARLDAALAAVPATPGLGHLMRYTVSPLGGSMMWPLLGKTMFKPAPARFEHYADPDAVMAAIDRLPEKAQA